MRFVSLLLLIFVSTPSLAGVFTTKYYHLKGPVKQISITRGVTPYKILRFNREGRLVQYQRNHHRKGTTRRDYHYDKRGTLKRITQKSYGGQVTELTYQVTDKTRHILDLGPKAKRFRYQVFHLDRQGRVVKIVMLKNLKPGEKPVSSHTREFFADGRIRRKKVSNRSASVKYAVKVDTIYEYKNNVPVRVKSKATLENGDVFELNANFKTDHYGNWVSKEGIFSITKPGESGERNRLKRPTQEQRFIEYYK